MGSQRTKQHRSLLTDMDLMQGFIFGPPGWGEMLLLGVVGLLIFGKRLPEVGKNLGRGIVEFKKGLSGVKDEIDSAGQLPPTSSGAPQTHSPPPASSPMDAEEATPTNQQDRLT